MKRSNSTLRLPLGLIACALAVPPATLAGESSFSFQDETGQHIDVRHDGETVARYMYARDTSTDERAHETYKPYLHIVDPQKKGAITKGAGGRYTHHRGIFVGWSKVTAGGERYDLWHMKGVEQVHKKFLRKEVTDGQAVLTSLIHWNDRDGEPLIREERTMIFRPLPAPGIVQVDLSTRLEALRDLKLDGDPEHAGVQYRPANEVDTKKTRYHFPEEGADPRKDRDFPWVGEEYVLDGKTYGVVHMNHPKNPEGTIYSAYRDYGRFGAFFTRELDRGETLQVWYRFHITASKLPEKEKIQAAWKAFAGQAEALSAS